MLAAAGCGGRSNRHVSALGVISARTPSFPAAGFHTYGSYPLVQGGIDLRHVNVALEAAVAADQRRFLPQAKNRLAHASRATIADRLVGDYDTDFDRGLVSASTAVVSVLLPRTREVLPLDGLPDGWLGITLRVPSGERVTFADLFADRRAAVRFLRARARDQSPGGGCTSNKVSPSTAVALLPTGLVVGIPSKGPCYRFTLTVPYRDLRRYFSPLGARLAAGARWPSYRPDAKNLTYCRRPDLSGAELSASGEVGCATARRAERTVFSPACSKESRCTAVGFVCTGGWVGSPGSFEATNHAICRKGRRRIQMDEG